MMKPNRCGDDGKWWKRMHDHLRECDAVQPSHAAQHYDGCCKPRGAKRHPGYYHRQHCQGMSEQARQTPWKPPLHEEIQPVQPAPQDEIPGRAVPQPTQQHRRQQIDITPHGPSPVAAKRDVDVVTQEAAQRDVPAVPEVADVRRLIG
jgi:hypothetical protein